jgi:hypothetical protein
MDGTTDENDGHAIEFVGDESEPILLIDGEPLRWGRFSDDGQFFLYRYAYDPDDTLEGVARRYVEYRDLVQRVRAETKGEQDALP